MTSDDLKSDLTRSSDYHSSEDAKLKTLEDLSSVTGGELFRLSADAEPVFDHVVRESSAYYLLGFGPDSSERNAKSHRIAVTVSRPGVTVRARPEFTIPKAGAAAAAARKLTLPDMLKDRNTYRDVPLRAAAYAIRTSDKGINVVVAAESLDRSIAIDAAAFALIDTNFNLMTLAWPAPASALGEPRIISGGVVPPGPYRLRVAVTAKDGRRGTADYEFVAGLTKATPLEVGDLMIGQGQPDGTFLPELVIGDRAAATGYLELQGSLPVGTAISATFELAADAAGPPLASVPGIVLPTETGTRLSARGAIPIGSFAPGDYVVRAIVKVDGAIVARVMRAVRKQRDQ
jgi:hypothetical protein